MIPTMMQSGKILDLAETVSEGLARFAPRQDESDPKGDRGGRIADIVDRVGKQRDAVGRDNNDHLQRSSDRQDHERPLDRPDAALVCRETCVDNAVRVAVAAAIGMIMM